MKIGPKFKIAKRLGAPIFEKTQSQKFALSEARGGRVLKRRGQTSDFKRQLIEKQKMRFSYGITEKQLRRYVDEAMEKSHQPIALLMERLELRLDNVVYRIGLAKTRRYARQMVSHGHIKVNGKRITVPSYKVALSDTITVRDGSKETGMFTTFAENYQPTATPSWITFDAKKMEAKLAALPTYQPAETMFDPEQVLEYYSR